MGSHQSFDTENTEVEGILYLLLLYLKQKLQATKVAAIYALGLVNNR